jgi:dephospho-CoA kinase
MHRDGRTRSGRPGVTPGMRIALTGGMGSGKSTVARLLRDRGAIIVDADAIAREVVEPGQPALDEIREAFGPGVIDADGRLDRSRLAEIVFADADALARLNAITHPRIAERSAELLDGAPAGAVVVYDMPLLVEQGPAALAGWDRIIVVDCPDATRLERLVERGLDIEDARRRIAAQATRAERLAIADAVLDNSGDLSALESQLDCLWAEWAANDA